MQARFVIDEIGDLDFDPKFVPPKTLDDYKVRKAARGVLVRDNQIALLYVSKLNYHKLPGGGVELDETTVAAFTREIGEETGCDCQIVNNRNQNSVIIETRDQFKLLQISYIFYSEIVGEPRELHLMPDEIEDGFELKWVRLDEAISLIQNDNPEDYEGKFIQKRDLAILEFYKNA